MKEIQLLRLRYSMNQNPETEEKSTELYTRATILSSCFGKIEERENLKREHKIKMTKKERKHILLREERVIVAS